MSENNTIKPRVALIKGSSPQENYLEGINKLGGISQFIDEGDKVFLKISLRLPFGCPTNSNLDLIKEVIVSCKEAGASKIYVGSYPTKGVALQLFEDLMGLESYFKALGAEFIYLDNSDYYKKRPKKARLNELKKKTLMDVSIGEESIQIPQVFMESDKIIVLTQVNVNPLFMCDLSLVNYSSILPNSYRDIHYSDTHSPEEIVKHDLFRQDQISTILNTYSIKKPQLTINDMSYVLENAGPFNYRSSNLIKTNVLILGTDLISVDAITLRFLGFDILENDLLIDARERSLGPENVSDITLLGEDIGKISIDVHRCSSKLENIQVQNIYAHTGDKCSGCLLKAYHFFNFMDTKMYKDMKNISTHSFLVGLNPPEPLFEDNIILFGDCAIKSTKKYDFRTKMKKTFIRKKDKEVENKNIFEIAGCPPDIDTCLKQVYDYFDKSDMPNLNYIMRTLKSSDFFKYKKLLMEWEDMK